MFNIDIKRTFFVWGGDSCMIFIVFYPWVVKRAIW